MKLFHIAVPKGLNYGIARETSKVYFFNSRYSRNSNKTLRFTFDIRAYARTTSQLKKGYFTGLKISILKDL